MQAREVEKPTLGTAPSYDLTKFKLTRILRNNTLRKSIALLGTFPDLSATHKAIVLFEKSAFHKSDVQTVEKTETVFEVQEDQVEDNSKSEQSAEKPSYFTSALKVQTQFVNNIYGSFQCVPTAELNDPNPETGFVLLPDFKWDGKNVDTLYLLAIVHKHNIKSLRDLNSGHLPMLRNLRTRAAAAIEERYGLSTSQLQMYFHYQPSFYHLHLHINPMRGDAGCDKSHMLETVINNLELLSDYYQRATLPFVLYDGSKMFEKYEEEVSVRKCVKRPATSAVDNGDSKTEHKAKKPKLEKESVGSNEEVAQNNVNAAEVNEESAVTHNRIRVANRRRAQHGARRRRSQRERGAKASTPTLCGPSTSAAAITADQQNNNVLLWQMANCLLSLAGLPNEPTNTQHVVPSTTQNHSRRSRRRPRRQRIVPTVSHRPNKRYKNKGGRKGGNHNNNRNH